ncbi:MAG TPA: hypothetical protein VGY56_10530 [Verrucomicrobiae bacterium]|nr:hypothetical protein [Verrucomicrobiae bacterium]
MNARRKSSHESAANQMHSEKRITGRHIFNHNCIQVYFHCKQCIAELPPGTSPREYAQLEVGWTELGIQVWCKRHEYNVAHIDFEGLKFPANTEATPPRQRHHDRPIPGRRFA